MSLEHRFDWQAPSEDPNDEQFGDCTENTSLAEADEFAAVLIGEPYDGAVVGRPGAREGPAAIREALAAVKTHHFDAGPVSSVGDLGTVEIPDGESVAAVQETVRETAAEVHDSDAIPVFLGGDNSLTYANVLPLLEADTAADGGYVTDGGFGEDDEESVGDVEHFDPTAEGEEDESESEEEAESVDEGAGSEETETEAQEEESETEDEEIEAGESEAESQSEAVGVISLDAHLDCREVDGQPTSGTPYRQLFDAGLDALAVLGARHFETSTAYAEFLRDQGGDIITAEEVGDDPVAAADRALATMDDVDSVYVSVDMDVLDVTAGPGVSAPTPGGITTRELFRIVRLLASDDRLAGVEIVETAPQLCPDGRTAEAAGRALAHALATMEVSHG